MKQLLLFPDPVPAHQPRVCPGCGKVHMKEMERMILRRTRALYEQKMALRRQEAQRLIRERRVNRQII